MSKKTHDTRQEERNVLDTLVNAFPLFLGGVLNWHNGPENGPPDFLASTRYEKRFGLEITEWLAKGQTEVSISNQESRFQLLQAIASEQLERPYPLTRVVICDRLDVPFRRNDRDKYVQEIHKLISESAPLWHEKQALGIFKVSDFSKYPTLRRYCICATLYGPPRFCNDPKFDWTRPGLAWIAFEPVGGVYDPQWAVNALLERIDAKVRKYSGIHKAQDLDHFTLLIHYGLRGLMHNTPYSGKSASLEDAARQAHGHLKTNYGEFDSAYLYMNFNGGKLIKVFPELVTLLEFSH
jgi:hypothetical protein